MGPIVVDLRGFTPFARTDLIADLLAIIPPKANLSPISNLTPDKIGKLPGVPTEDGWIGHTDWTSFTNSPRVLQSWLKELGDAPCNIGLNARTYHAFDVDTKSREFAAAILPVIERHLSASIKLTGIRIGRAPGFLVPFKPVTPMKKARLVFLDALGDKHAVERLGVGQQYVLAGVHPSGVPYRWVARGGSTFDQITTVLPPVSIDFQAFTADCIAAVAGQFDLAKRVADRVASGSPQAALEGLLAPDVADVEEALAALPNGPEDGVDRDDWISVLHAVAGATGKSEEGKALWMEWSLRWSDDPGHVAGSESRWDTLDASSLHLGWPWLSEKASGANADFRLAHAVAEFDEPVEHLNGKHVDTEGLFDEPVHDHPTREEIQDAIDLLTPSATGPEVQAITKLIARSRVPVIDHENFLRQIKVATKYSMQGLRRQLTNDIADQFRDAGDIGIRLSQVALNKLGKGKVAFHKSRWWRYDGKMWVSMEDIVIRAALIDAVRNDERLLQGRGGGQAHCDAMIRQAISLLSGVTSTLLKPMDDPAFAMRPSLNFRNGTLDINPDATLNFRPHDPKDCFTWMINADYDELASCPRYDATLRDMLSLTWHRLSSTDPDYDKIKAAVDRARAREDKPVTLPDGRLAWRMLNSIRVADIDDNVRMVNEMLGYMLSADRSARCFAVLKGNGINGKSALVETITSRLTGMSYNASLELLKSRFTISQLRGKRVLVVDEGTHGTLADDVIKMLCENKAIDADVKGRETIQFMLTVFPVILTNNFFTTPDASEGMLSRILFVPFNRRYDERQRHLNPWLAIRASEEEISGIMNRLVDGLRRVLARRYIQITQASAQMKEHWRQRNTPEVAFIADTMTTDRAEGEKSEGEMVAKIHASYVWWFNQNIGGGQRPRGKMRFAEVFNQLGYEVYKSDGMDRVRGMWLDPDKLSRLSGSSEFEPLGSEF